MTPDAATPDDPARWTDAAAADEVWDGAGLEGRITAQPPSDHFKIKQF